MIYASVYHSAEGGMALRSLAIWPQSVTDKANAPGARMSPGGAAIYAGNCARLISGSSRPMLRSELQPGFMVDVFGLIFSRAFSRFSKRPWNRRT